MEAAARGRRLLISIPALNEARTVGDVVRAIPGSLPGVASIEVVVIDDGSQDATVAQALAAGAGVLRHMKTRGVGAAFHTALDEAIQRQADLLVTLDADGQFDPREIPRLIEPVLAGRADLATASRFVDPRLTPPMPLVKRWGNRFMSRWISNLVGTNLCDVSCGMRCYSRRALLRLGLLGDFTYTQEVIMSLAMHGASIVEVPMRVGQREFGQSKVARSVVRYGLKSATIIFRAYRDYYPLRFFGSLSIGFLALAAPLAVFSIYHYAQHGTFFPHTWAIVTAGACALLAAGMLHLGVIGDLLSRHRVYLEELLYRQRSRAVRGSRRR